MRRNTPVTQNEYLLNAGSTLMSTTNTKSHITYANSAFIEASGYKEEHLLGEPHNLIRHPDMPAEAFGDMWFTLQQGETWTGLVKNRRHNGDCRIYQRRNLLQFLLPRCRICQARWLYKNCCNGRVVRFWCRHRKILHCQLYCCRKYIL